MKLARVVNDDGHIPSAWDVHFSAWTDDGEFRLGTAQELPKNDSPGGMGVDFTFLRNDGYKTLWVPVSCAGLITTTIMLGGLAGIAPEVPAFTQDGFRMNVFLWMAGDDGHEVSDSPSAWGVRVRGVDVFLSVEDAQSMARWMMGKLWKHTYEMPMPRVVK